MRLKDVMDKLELEYAFPSNGGEATHIPDQPGQRVSVIGLVFASAGMRNQQEFRYRIKEDDVERWGSDHRMLKIEVLFLEGEPEVEPKRKIEAWSEEEDDYVSQVSNELTRLAREAVDSKEKLTAVMDQVTTTFKRAWEVYSEEKNPSKHGKVWWNKDCKEAYGEMKLNGGRSNWTVRTGLKRTIQKTKRNHFDKKIKQMASDRKQPWDLMPWARECKLPATEAILNDQGESCNDTDMLSNTLHSTYNSASNCNVNLDCMTVGLNKLPERGWNPFSRQELLDALKSCAKNTAPGPDHISWRLLKRFIKFELGVGELITKVADASIDLGHWPDHFKRSVSVIIPKPGKPSYNKAKSFRPIVLLNTMGKLIEKMIARRLQFEGLESGTIHPCQTGGIMQQSVEDAAVALTHHVCMGWANKKATSVLAFDIAQFFPSLNHFALSKIIEYFGFVSKVVSFFSDYLTNGKTQYAINGETSSLYDSNVGVGQGSALSPILSALYIAPIFHLLDKWIMDFDESMYHPPLTAFLSFVDNGLLVATADNVYDRQSSLKEAYAHITSLFTDFGLVMEHTKTELFNFALKSNNYESDNPTLDLGFVPFTNDTPLIPKRIWRYLGIFFDHNLTFCEHVKHYATKSISTVRSMKILGNPSHGLTPKQKRLLYISCVQPIATYGFRCWYKPGI
jgi:hypothetical protein